MPRFREFDRRARLLARRPWTARERRIVWRGLTGRFALAVEPLLGGVFMGLLTWGIVYRAHHVASDATLIKIAWIFAVGMVAFGGYFGGSMYDISSPFASFIAPEISGFAENTTSNTAIVIGIDAVNACGAPVVATVDLSTGAVGSFNGPAGGTGGGIAVDSSTNKALAPSFCGTGSIPSANGGLGIYDLTSKSAFQVPMPAVDGNLGSGGILPTIDQTHALFLVAEAVPPDLLSNNNSVSLVYVYNERGRLRKTLAQFNLYNIFISGQEPIPLNSTNRVGYMVGLGSESIVPFSY